MSEKGGFPDGPPPSEPPPPYTGSIASAPQPYAPQPYGVAQAQYGGQQYGMQHQMNNVVVAQPGITHQAVMGHVPDNMGLAIFVTICCFWPLGIVAIMRASEARSAVNRGDMHSAMLMSSQSKRYSMWALGCGIGSLVVAIVIVVATVVSINNNCYYPYCY